MNEELRGKILGALSAVRDPDLGRDIVSLGFVKNLTECDGVVKFEIELTTPACPVKDELQQQAIDVVKKVPGVTEVYATMTAAVRGARVATIESLKSVKNVIAIASGKGGVGKSTVATNLALALHKLGASVGLMDGDIYGPSIPAMLGVKGQPGMGPDKRLLPLTAHGIKFISLGLLVSEDTPVIWRGPMASKMIQQLLGGVAWGDLDYLLIDLPPGTGDIQLTLTQSAPLAGAVIVTTPQDVALNIAKKGLKMFTEVNVPVLGIIENMSTFTCPDCGKKHHIFRSGGGARMAKELGLPLLGEIPIDPRLCESGDEGVPMVARHPESEAARAFLAAAQNVAAQLSIANVEGERAVALPVKMDQKENLRITWDDGHTSEHSFWKLRVACPCAVCRDEWSGQLRIRADDIAREVHPKLISPVGRYALNFSWSDGHNTGIYSYARLRESCECSDCAKQAVQVS